MENKICILCSGNRLTELPRYKRANLVKCNECGFVFSKYIPTLNELTSYYTNYPRGGDLSPITIKRYNELLDIFESFRQSNKLLDYGCSNGQFLEIAAKRGWEIFGLEFAGECFDNCAKKGIKIYLLDNLPEHLFLNEFDIVTSFEVIEHINNPNDKLNIINKILRKEGLFYFTTPNFNSLSRKILKEKWNVIGFPEHLSYYTPQTIHQLLAKNGFRKKNLFTSGISLSRFKQSLNPSGNPPGFNSDETLREKTETKFIYSIAKKLINYLLNLFKAGDSIKGFYIKNS